MNNTPVVIITGASRGLGAAVASWLGTRKTLTADQKALAADVFQAEGEFLSAGKKLLDTK